PAAAALSPPPEQASDHAIKTARTLAAAADSLEALRAAMNGFEQCPLKHGARSLVFADGDPAADLMLVGEAPGQMEDAQGLPFVGPSGHLLDRMLGAIGRDRRSVYIANILPWRPPLNRKPELTEIHMCLPFLVRHIELAAPKAVLALGGTAAQHLLGQDAPMHRLRGAWHDCRFGAHTVPVMATYHPAYLLRSPQGKRAAWADFLAVQKALAPVEKGS
ncbi:MAG: uracil-DNA glycosylase family protein, partial [Alphaproteobacteria bacterium]